MEKIKKIFMKIKSNKRLMYLFIIGIICLFSVALNITFSVFTSTNSGVVSNVNVNNLSYQLSINGIQGNIITAPADNVTKADISLVSLNDINTKYEINYKVCSNSACTSFINTPADLKVEYSSRTVDNVNGSITDGGVKSIRIVVENFTNQKYYIKIEINAGYNHNTLALLNTINSEYSEEDLMVVPFIDGDEASNFPTSSNYDEYEPYIECFTGGKASNIKADIIWNDTAINGSRWTINFSTLNKGENKCNIYFQSHYSWDNVNLPSNLLLSKIKTTVSTPATTPGSAINNSNESIIASATDDLGASYYYRGTSQNNYVKYANMCWRIVRVTGSGRIKLVLFNNNGLSNTNNTPLSDNPCATSQNGSGKSYALYNSTTTTTFNSDHNHNAYVGLMYGGSTIVTTLYPATHENTNKSTILQYLESWYSTVLSKQAGFDANDLTDAVWCNDKKTYSGTVGGKSYGTTTSGGGKTPSMYDGGHRLIASSSNVAGGTGPSYNCQTDNNDGRLSRFTVSSAHSGNQKLTYKIGLLTADEVAFAGSAYELSNSSYYLYENTGSEWWTLTPNAVKQGSSGGIIPTPTYTAYVFTVKSDGAISAKATDETLGVRPSIVLQSITKSTGTGTSSDPYVVQ